jgi:hypothetical protein
MPNPRMIAVDCRSIQLITHSPAPITANNASSSARSTFRVILITLSGTTPARDHISPEERLNCKVHDRRGCAHRPERPLSSRPCAASRRWSISGCSSGRLAANMASPGVRRRGSGLRSTCLSVTWQARSKQLCVCYPQVLATILMAGACWLPNGRSPPGRPRPASLVWRSRLAPHRRHSSVTRWLRLSTVTICQACQPIKHLNGRAFITLTFRTE